MITDTALVLLVFFFSSRRRHTRWPRDWSSDMCSSDLDQTGRDRGDQPESCPDTVWLARSVLSSYPNRAWGAPSYTFVILKSGRADSIPHLLLNLAQLLRSEEHTSELQSRGHLVCRLLL